MNPFHGPWYWIYILLNELKFFKLPHKNKLRYIYLVKQVGELMHQPKRYCFNLMVQLHLFIMIDFNQHQNTYYMTLHIAVGV